MINFTKKNTIVCGTAFQMKTLKKKELQNAGGLFPPATRRGASLTSFHAVRPHPSKTPACMANF